MIYGDTFAVSETWADAVHRITGSIGVISLLSLMLLAFLVWLTGKANNGELGPDWWGDTLLGAVLLGGVALVLSAITTLVLTVFVAPSMKSDAVKEGAISQGIDNFEWDRHFDTRGNRGDFIGSIDGEYVTGYVVATEAQGNTYQIILETP